MLRAIFICTLALGLGAASAFQGPGRLTTAARTIPLKSAKIAASMYDNYAQAAYVQDRENRLASPQTVRLHLGSLRWRSFP